jgi:hypothetical protein
VLKDDLKAVSKIEYPAKVHRWDDEMEAKKEEMALKTKPSQWDETMVRTTGMKTETKTVVLIELRKEWMTEIPLVVIKEDEMVNPKARKMGVPMEISTVVLMVYQMAVKIEIL